jgi:hypothetical protein
MPSIDPEIIHRFEEERAFKALKFDPVTVDILEVNLIAVRFLFLMVFFEYQLSDSHFQDSPPSIVRLSLDPTQLEAWIKEVTFFDQAL